MHGKLLVLEGTDGSGKATQTRYLYDALKEKIPCRIITFPRYGQPSAALIEAYLRGELGKRPGDVNAYAASLFYAVDRYASWKQDWGDFYASGGLILSDRYTTSNAVHQAEKLPITERQNYLDWLFHLEYQLLGLPVPDIVCYLSMSPNTSARLRELRRQQTASATAQTNMSALLDSEDIQNFQNNSTDENINNINTQGTDSIDIHEQDSEYQIRCAQSGLEIARLCGWRIITCDRDGIPRPVEDIHRELVQLVQPLLA